jgi:hypothetical protein
MQAAGRPISSRLASAQAVIDFGTPRTFAELVLWWHGAEYTPDTGTIEYWDGAQWVLVSQVQRRYGTMHEEGPNAGYSDSDIYTFPAVTGSKVRYTFDNSGLNIVGTYDIHGWLYEVEAFGCTNVDLAAPGWSDVPADQVLEATGPAGATASYTIPTAVDDEDGPRPVSCVPASGTTFALGTTTVTCNASDSSGNGAPPVQFNVTVQDTTAPALTVPSYLTAQRKDASGVSVKYPVSAADLVDPAPTVSCCSRSTPTAARSSSSAAPCR